MLLHEILRDEEMSSRGDGNEFSETFDEAKDDGSEPVGHVFGMEKGRKARIELDKCLCKLALVYQLYWFS